MVRTSTPSVVLSNFSADHLRNLCEMWHFAQSSHELWRVLYKVCYALICCYGVFIYLFIEVNNKEHECL